MRVRLSFGKTPDAAARPKIEAALRAEPGIRAVEWEGAPSVASVAAVPAALDVAGLESALAGFEGRVESHETIRLEFDEERADARFAPLLGSLSGRAEVVRVLANLSGAPFRVAVTVEKGASSAADLVALAEEKGLRAKPYPR